MPSSSYCRLHSALMCSSTYCRVGFLKISCICAAFQQNWSSWFLVTRDIFAHQRPLITWIATSFSLQSWSQPSFFLFQSANARFYGYDRKYEPDSQMTVPVVSPLELLQVHLGSQPRGWDSPRGTKQAHITLENHDVSSMCLDCSLPAPNRIKVCFWTAWNDHAFNHCSQVSQRYLKKYQVLTH